METVIVPGRTETLLLTSSDQRSSYKDVTVTCRAPRAVISFDASSDWESRAAIVIAAMGKYWGGSQFILIPHVGGKINPALLRVATIHDPDYVFEFNFSDDELAKCAGNYQTPERKLRPAELKMRKAYHSRPPAALVNATSVYRIPRSISETRSPSGGVHMTSDSMGNITELASMPGGQENGVYQAVPETWGGSLGLALAMRVGFVEPPRLPFAMDPASTVASQDLQFALGSNNPTNAILTASGNLAVGNPIPAKVPTSWTRTHPGIGLVYFVADLLRPSIAVIGSTVDDYCLAFALRRMTGYVQWFPDDLLKDEHQIERVGVSIFEFLADTYQRNAESVITSISRDEESLDQLVAERRLNPL